MTRPMLAAACMFLLWITPAQVSSETTEKKCVNDGFHKPKPSPQTDLKDSCVAWRNESCCDVKYANNKTNSHLNTERNICATNISEECARYFTKDSCFFKCSPDLGPWIVSNSQKQTETIHGVPLCTAQCTAWYDACKNQKTCTQLWNNTNKSREQSKDTENACLNEANCVNFETVFSNATAFCSKVSSTMWQPSNETNCIKPFHVTATTGNQTENNNSTSGNNSAPILCLHFVLVFVLIPLHFLA